MEERGADTSSDVSKGVNPTQMDEASGDFADKLEKLDEESDESVGDNYKECPEELKLKMISALGRALLDEGRESDGRGAVANGAKQAQRNPPGELYDDSGESAVEMGEDCPEELKLKAFRALGKALMEGEGDGDSIGDVAQGAKPLTVSEEIVATEGKLYDGFEESSEGSDDECLEGLKLRAISALCKVLVEGECETCDNVGAAVSLGQSQKEEEALK